MKLIWPGSVPSKTTGRSYCFQVKLLTVCPESKRVLLNQYQHHLRQETVLRNDEVFMQLEDLVDIFSPYLELIDRRKIRCGDSVLIFTADYRKVDLETRKLSETGELLDEVKKENSILLQTAPFAKNGFVFLPIEEVMKKVFGQFTKHLGKYLLIAEKEEDTKITFDGPQSPAFSAKRLDFLYSKDYGDLHFTIWVDEAKRLNNYRMYVPFSYDGSRPMKMAVVLHGGNGNSDSTVIRAGQKLQYYAEKYNYILLIPNSFVHGSNYGSLIPPQYMFPEREPKLTEEEKKAGVIPTPDFYTDAENREFRIAENQVKQVLDEVLTNWNIDREHMYVMGNSMGSCGTFHLLGTFQNMFRAGVPTACMPLTEYIDPKTLFGKPILFLIGTEDNNNPKTCYTRAMQLKEQGVDIEFRIIGGGYHPTAWISELDETFRFFESH